jgi:hypothetical protein
MRYFAALAPRGPPAAPGCSWTEKNHFPNQIKNKIKRNSCKIYQYFNLFDSDKATFCQENLKNTLSADQNTTKVQLSILKLCTLFGILREHSPPFMQYEQNTNIEYVNFFPVTQKT